LKKVLTTALVFCCFVFIYTGCSHDLFHSRLSEGTIEYKIVVLDSANPMAKMAPDKMTVKFKNNISYAEIIAGMGLFETSFINDEPNKKLTQMVRMLNKKWAYVGDTTAINKELSHDIQFDVTETKETKVIAGYTCKKAIGKSKDGKAPDVELYYTEDIKLENPNWATPFKSIEGVLMQYRIAKYGFYMEFTAEKVEPEKIDETLFKLPADYKMITKQQLDDLYKGFQ
jgi:GLPGLI family protein